MRRTTEGGEAMAHGGAMMTTAPARRGRRVRGALRALVVAVVVPALLLLVACERGDDGPPTATATPAETAAATATTTATATATPATPTPTPTPDASEASIDRSDPEAALAIVARRTAALYGLGEPPMPAVTLGTAPLAERLRELLADPETAAEVSREEHLLRLLGLIPQDAHLLELMEGFLLEGVAGLYDPEDEHFYVRLPLSGRFTLMAESTASHEYAHFLQDRLYGLEALHAEAQGDRDRERALSALIEGDAVYVQQEYMLRHFNFIELLGLGVASLLSAPSMPDDLPGVIERETLFVYGDGLAFVTAVYDAGVTRDELFAAPPLTTAAVLHPERYLEGIPAQSVSLALTASALPAGWVADPVDSLGALTLIVWLEELGARGRDARSAAAGWDGDASHVITRDGEPVALVARVQWASTEDATEFHDAASAALESSADYDDVTCPACAFPVWRGAAGVAALVGPGSGSGSPTLLLVAPTLTELLALLDAVE